MRFPLPILIAGMIVLSSAPAVLAHHSLDALYDPKQILTLTGTITKTDWSNPHVHFFFDVPDASRTVNWQVEMGSPNAQILSGWKIDTLKTGDRVKVSLYRARDGSNVGFARKVTKVGP
ncbi:MAG TPA: DUF6152 family protein [Bryobacteraceae bacterium]|nr:DUF6152 family protein [Bryobacteraceae bacterium]